MPGYIIANYNIDDLEAYQKYPPAVRPTIGQYGGKILVADLEIKPVEGTPGQVIVVIEFESEEAAQQWYESPENTAVKGLRTSVTDGWVALAKGFVMPKG